jgi:hypothetical protein
MRHPLEHAALGQGDNERVDSVMPVVIPILGEARKWRFFVTSRGIVRSDAAPKVLKN